MSKPSEIGEDTKLTLDLKTIGIVIAGAVSLALMYTDLNKEIDVAKELPKPEISRTEYELKDELVRSTIMDTQEDVEEIKEDLRRIEDKIDQLRKSGM